MLVISGRHPPIVGAKLIAKCWRRVAKKTQQVNVVTGVDPVSQALLGN
jgi:hypothetical protein